MKLLDWQKFFTDQRAIHGKVVFSVAELANAARTSLHSVNTELGRLVGRGIITRYAQGRYGPLNGVHPEAIVSAIDSGAYITGFYALFRQHLVTQIPNEVICFTNRRHNRRTDRMTPAGKLRFIRAPVPVYAKPAGQGIAGPEQALCDFVWLNLRDGIEPKSLVTFRRLRTLNRRRLEKLLTRYPANVGDSVKRIIDLDPLRTGIMTQAYSLQGKNAR